MLTTLEDGFDIYAVLEVFDRYADDDDNLGELYKVFNTRLGILKQDAFLGLVVKTANEYYSLVDAETPDRVAASIVYENGGDKIAEWFIDNYGYCLNDAETAGVNTLLDYAIQLRNNY